MPEVLRARIDSFKIKTKDDGTIEIIEPVFVKDCQGGTPLKKIYSVLSAPNMPREGDACEIDGLFCTGREIIAWGDTDATVNVTWSTKTKKQFNAGGIPWRLEVGVTLQQVETEFDADNRQLPFAKRTPLTVSYKAAGSSTAEECQVTVPVLIPRPSIIFETVEKTNPTSKARQLVGRVNSKAWLGNAAEEVLCLSIQGISEDGGKTWRVRYEFAIDWFDKWRPTARFVDAETKQPKKLTAADVANGNGIKQVKVQPSADFNALKLLVK